jgi:DNA-binding GntR family transcriptional regulator
VASAPSTTADGLIAERAYRELRDRIVTLQLPPGAILREEELMRDMAIGRTPLREAVKRLALENLVAVQPRRGTFVTDIDVADIIHITEVRIELEGQAAELAARRMDAASRAEAEELLAALEALDSDDTAALMDFDERIHDFVHRTARNPYLAATLERYFALSLRIWYVVLDRVPGLGGAVHDQDHLLQALLARDAARARELMREHVSEFQREILAAFSRG